MYEEYVEYIAGTDAAKQGKLRSLQFADDLEALSLEDVQRLLTLKEMQQLVDSAVAGL